MSRRTPRRVIALVIVGLVGGLLSGAFGVGGGIVMVPLLIWLVGLDQRRASATSLVAIIPTSMAGSITYLAHGSVLPLVALIIAVGGIAGSLVGSKLLRTLPLAWLRWLFFALLVVVAVRLFFEVPERGTGLELTGAAIAGLVALGLVMGIASGLFGIGGGIIMVPVLVAVFGVSDLVAKGTSLLAIIPTALTGSIANVRAKLIGVGDGVIVGAAATVASFGGVALAFLMSKQVSAILFAVLILAVVAQLTVRAIRERRAPAA